MATLLVEKTRLFPEACLFGAKLVYFGCWSEPIPQNLGQLCRWPHLRYMDSWAVLVWTCCCSCKLYSYLLPPPFPGNILPQSWTADNWKTLILKFTLTPNMLGTIVLVFIQQRIHLVQNNKLCTVHTKKYEVHNNIVRCTDFSQENNMHTLKYEYIHYRNPSLKIGLHSPETPKVGWK